MTGALALVAALTISSQIQTHPAGLDSIGPSRGRSLRTAPIMDKLYQQANKPALDFNFARFKDLHDDATGATSLVTFSRSAAQSPGTYVGSDGLIKTAAVNLQLYSEEFDQWTNSNTTDLANQVDAPDGKQTADEIEATAANGTIVRGVTTTAIDYTFSVYLKRKTGTGDIDISVDGSTWVTQSVTGDWQRFSVTQIGVAGTSNAGIRLVTSGDEVYAWGAQLQEGTTAAPYIHTTSQALAAPRFDHDPVTGESLGLLVEEQRVNHWPYSESSTGITFATGSSAGASNSAVAPDGTMTADEINVNGGNAYRIYNTFDNKDLTFSVYAKGIAGETVRLQFYDYGTAGFKGAQTFTLNEDWQRLSVTANIIGNPTPGASDVIVYVADNRTGAGTATSMHIWGMQLEEGAFETSQIPTTGTAQTRYADIAAVQDEDFSTTNLLAYSESFDVGWTLTGFDAFGSGSVANATVSPDGQTTADFLRPSTASGFKGVEQSTAFPATATKTIYVKDSGVRYVQMNFSSLRSLNYANYDLQTATVTQTGGAGFVGASISDAGNGWYRIEITETGAATTATHAISPVPSGTSARGAAYTGDGTSGIYLWGASLTATEYPVAYTTTRNLLTDSQDFERSTWTKSALSSWNDGYQDPFGGNEGFRFVESATTGNHGPSKSVTYQTADYVLSFYAKKGARQYLETLMSLTDGNSFAVFDLDAGVVAASGTGATATITDAGNGWFRCTVSKALSAASTTMRIRIGQNSISFFYLGDGVSDVYLHGMQLEPGTTATDYVRTVDVVGKAYQWYEPTEGTVFVEAQAAKQGFGGQLWFNRDETSNRGWSVVNGTTTDQRVYFRADDNSLKNLFLGSVTASSVNKISSAIDADDVLGVMNGGTVQSAALTAYYTFNKLRIGYQFTAGGGIPLNGHIKRLTYWPVRQSDSTLQVITQ